MPPIDWEALLAVLIPIILECLEPDPEPVPVEVARERLRKPGLEAVVHIARKARKQNGAPLSEAHLYRKAVRERAASLTDSECDELIAEALEA